MIIDEKGRIFKIINIFDLMAIALALALGLTAWLSWKQYHVQKTLNLEQERLKAYNDSISGLQRIEEAFFKENFFLISNFPDSLFDQLEPGMQTDSLATTNPATLLEVIAFFPQLLHIGYLNKSGIGLYLRDSSNLNILVKIRYQCYRYTPDSVVYNKFPVRPGLPIQFFFPEFTFQAIPQDFSPEAYTFSRTARINNIPQILAFDSTFIGNNYLDKLGQPIITIEELMRRTHTQTSETILNQQTTLVTPNIDLLLRIQCRVYPFNGSWYTNFSPLGKEIQTFVALNDDTLAMIPFQLTEITNSVPLLQTLNLYITIHQLNTMQRSSIKEGDAIFNSTGNKIGMIEKIVSHPMRDFKFSSNYSGKYNFQTNPDPLNFKLTCQSVIDGNLDPSNYFSIDQKPLYLNTTLYNQMSFLIDSVMISKPCAVYFPESGNGTGLPYRGRISLDTPLPEGKIVLLNLANGNYPIGQVNRILGKNLYDVSVVLEKQKGGYYWKSQYFSANADMNFLFYHDNLVVATNGRFYPETRARFEFLPQDKTLLKNSWIMTWADLTPNELTIKSLTDSTVIGEAWFYHIEDLWYYDYPAQPWDLGMTSYIPLRTSIYYGKLLSIERVEGN